MNLTTQEQKAIDKFSELSKSWPSSLMLFSWSGTLCVIRIDNGEVVTTISGIRNDGGEPECEIRDGLTYLVLQ